MVSFTNTTSSGAAQNTDSGILQGQAVAIPQFTYVQGMQQPQQTGYVTPIPANMYAQQLLGNQQNNQQQGSYNPGLITQGYNYLVQNGVIGGNQLDTSQAGGQSLLGRMLTSMMTPSNSSLVQGDVSSDPTGGLGSMGGDDIGDDLGDIS